MTGFAPVEAYQRSFDDRLRADYVVTSNNAMPLPAGAEERIQAVVGADGTNAQYVDQVEVNDKDVNAVTDTVNGMDPATLPAVYSFEWLDGSDEDVAALRRYSWSDKVTTVVTAGMSALDPATMLWTGGVVAGMPDAILHGFYENELVRRLPRLRRPSPGPDE